MQESLNAADLVVTDLKKSLAQQQTGLAETEEKWQLCSIELEKVKADFEAYKQTGETKQAALLKRAEDAEGQLQPVTEELSNLKSHISRMIGAVFGKCC